MSNELIYAMSTIGEMNIGRFYDFLNSISVQETGEWDGSGYDVRSKAIRVLDSLGYCEFDFNTRKVYMCPPSLVRLPTSGMPKAVLVGARIPRMVLRLKNAVKSVSDKALFLNVPQRRSVIDIPPLICVEADSVATLEGIASACGIASSLEAPSAWMLASMSQSVDQIRRQLLFIKRDWKSQPLTKFDTKSLMFAPTGEESENGLTDYTNPATKQHVHWYWVGPRAAEINRDWGRYAVIADRGKKIVLYDRNLRRLCIPRNVPLPTLLARALTFCTGTPPFNGRVGRNGMSDVPPGCSLDIYAGVPTSIAKMVVDKVHQELIYCETKGCGEVSVYD